MSNYKERDIIQLDRDGNYYCKHISAMTSEGLHAKSDIAAELGHRDMVIDNMKEVLLNVSKLLKEIDPMVKGVDLSDVALKINDVLEWK